MIRLTSAAFYDSLRLKEVRIFDSAVKKYNSLYGDMPYYYAVLYEVSLPGKVPFVLRADFSLDGKVILKESELLGASNIKHAITCEEALKKVLTLKPSIQVMLSAIYYHPLLNRIVWEITGRTNDDLIHYFAMDAENGDMLEATQRKDPNNQPVKVEELKKGN